MKKQDIFNFTLVLFFILNIKAQNTTLNPTFNNVAIGLGAPDWGVNVKTNFPEYTGGWGRGFFVSNETGGQHLLSIFAQGQSINGVSSVTSSAIGKDFNEPYITFLPNANVGIGTKVPSTNLDVFSSTSKSALRIGSYAIGTKNDTGIDMYVDNAGNKPVYVRIGLGVLTASLGQETGYMPFSTIISGVLTEKMRIHSNGNIGIGTTSPDAKLTVNGDIHAKEVKIDLSIPAPDYVFASDYKLKTLQEVEEYINKNSHLPEIPSAAALEKNGLMLAEMNMSLLKKVEELTIYAINQEKKINEQSKENIMLSERLSRIESQLNLKK
jgi:hypothetical protein